MKNLHGTTVQFQGVANVIIKACKDISNIVEKLKYLGENLDKEFNGFLENQKRWLKRLALFLQFHI